MRVLAMARSGRAARAGGAGPRSGSRRTIAFLTRHPSGLASWAALSTRRDILRTIFRNLDVLSPQTIGGTAVVLHLISDDVDALWQRALEAGAEACNRSRTSSGATGRDRSPIRSATAGISPSRCARSPPRSLPARRSRARLTSRSICGTTKLAFFIVRRPSEFRRGRQPNYAEASPRAPAHRSADSTPSCHELDQRPVCHELDQRWRPSPTS